MKRSSLFFLSFVMGSLIAACSSTVTGFPVDPLAESDSGKPSETQPDGGQNEPSPDAAPQPKPDAGPTQPSAPMFEANVNGKAAKVKSLEVRPKGTQYNDGVFYYYEIEATLEATPAIVTGQDGEPRITVTVAKKVSGTTACGEEHGPKVGFVEPTTSIREVQVSYKRFNGSSTIIASPKTEDGACSMTIHSDPAKGNAWGEAKGSVQAGTDEPTIAFDLAWFQPVKW